MSKELEAFQRIKKYYPFGVNEPEYLNIEVVETALKNYQEGLYNAKSYVKRTSKQALYDLLGLAIKNVHPSFWRLPEQLFEDVIKELKVLEIIKDKFEFNVFNKELLTQKLPIPKEEYELLKEYFKYE